MVVYDNRCNLIRVQPAFERVAMQEHRRAAAAAVIRHRQLSSWPMTNNDHVDDVPQPTFLKVPCHWIVALSLDEKLHQVMRGGVWCTVLYSCAQWFRVVCGSLGYPDIQLQHADQVVSDGFREIVEGGRATRVFSFEQNITTLMRMGLGNRARVQHALEAMQNDLTAAVNLLLGIGHIRPQAGGGV